MANHAAELYDYHAWANQTLLNRIKELPPELFAKEIQSSFSSLAKGFAHIYTTDSAWLDILTGKDMRTSLEDAYPLQAEVETKSIEEMESLFSALFQRYKAFISKQEDMERKLLLNNPYAGLRETSYAEIIQQVVNHATYHRGNLSAMLRQMGHASVMTEYALFWYSK